MLKHLNIRLSFDEKDEAFYNIILQNLHSLIKHKGAPDLVGQMLEKAKAEIEVFSAKDSKFHSLNMLFDKPKVLPDWLK